MTIELINRLITTLNDEHVTYCHWKSNFTLSETLSGEIDLDLLVDRKCLSQTLVILGNLGFKAAAIKVGMEPASIYHYYGFDYVTGQLVHAHLFSSILTGESFVKSHLLPFEIMMFENVYRIDQMKVASKPAELVLFVLRNFIKYGSLLDLVYVARESDSIKAELNWLQEGRDLSESLTLLNRYCPVIDERLFIQCVEALDTRASLFKKMLLAQHVRSSLRIYAKHSPFSLASAYFQLLWEQGIRRLSGNKKNKMLRAGGMVISFVGPEATGKSTLVSESKKWLGQAFAIRAIHAGKPPSSWITAPVNLVLPWVRSILPRLRTSRLEGHVFVDDGVLTPPKIEGLSGLVYALRSVGLAWDRRQLLVKARYLAANGEIIICDRYPSETIGAMDSPRLQENAIKEGTIGIVYNWLAHLEQRFYKQIPPPDAVLQLKVSVETAKRRNQERIKIGKETDAYLESRHRQSREWHMSGTKYISVIDTELPLKETILNVKKSIWELL